MDWSELNPDLLRHIAKKVTDISDFIRFRAVHKRWRSAVHLSDMPQQLPCFLKSKWNSNTSFDIQFRQFSSKREHVVPINNLSLEEERTIMYGSLNGFVLLRISKCSKPWLLLNPLTGFHIPLPFRKKGKYAHPIYFGPSCCPKTNPVKGIDVVFVFGEKKPLNPNKGDVACLWRYDYTKWKRIMKVPCSTDEERVTYCNGILCPISQETGRIRVIDINTGKIISVISGSSMKFMYLAETGGDMLVVLRDVQRERIYDTEYQFEVYQLEDFHTNPRLRRLKSIGNRVLFIDQNYYSLCLKASDCEGCQSNCIYLKTFSQSNGKVYCSIVRYDIENDTAQVNLFTDHPSCKWFVPSLF